MSTSAGVWIQAKKDKKDKDRDKMFTYLGGCVDPETWVEEAVVQQLLQ